MEQYQSYSRHVDLITKDEFVRLFAAIEMRGSWFSEKESGVFSFPGNVRSLAGRFLIKKRICDHIWEHAYRREIEILNDSFGKPEITLGKNIGNAIGRAGIKKIVCSISHSRNYITGMTIFCQ
jgi:phosphopantetheinyl transferase (holo-ACP synthase)